MTPAITRLYDRYEDASAAVAELEAAGVPHHDISLIANNAEGRHLSEGRRDGIADSEIGEDAGKGATTGGLLGGGALGRASRREQDQPGGSGQYPQDQRRDRHRDLPPRHRVQRRNRRDRSSG